MIAAGLLLYALSLIIPGGQWYLSLSSGVLTGLGISRAIRDFSGQDESFPKRQCTSDSEVEAATRRILRATGNSRPGRVIKLSSQPARYSIHLP
jgi:hypothetical protein